MFGAARTARFASVLLGAARTLDGVVEVFAYQKRIDGQIRTLAASGDRDGIGSRTQAYAQRFHVQDPIILARRSAAQSEGFVRRILAQDIPAGDYRALCFEQPGFADKVTFGFRRRSSFLVLSFYRSTSGERTSLRPLVALGQVAMAALSYHAGEATSTRSQWSSPQEADQMLRARLARSFPALTLREQEVVARTLLGESAAQIAARLGIKSTSVLTYRLRAYGRFGFRQASDFLAALLS